MSLAKQFEVNCAKQMAMIKDVFVQRIYDYSNFVGISNICDYIVYRKPTLFLLELKTTAGVSLPFRNISEYQCLSLNKYSKYKGIIAGIIVWFYEKDTTRFIPISIIEELRKTQKSIRFDYKDNRIIEIIGNKKRTYFEYNWKEFLDNASKRTNTKQSGNRLKANRRNCYKYSRQVYKRT